MKAFLKVALLIILSTPFKLQAQNINIGDDAQKVNAIIEWLVKDHNRTDSYGNKSNSVWEYEANYFDGQLIEVIHCYSNEYLLDLNIKTDFCKYYTMNAGQLSSIRTEYVNLTTSQLIQLFESKYKGRIYDQLYFEEDFNHYNKIYLSKKGRATKEYFKTELSLLPKHLQEKIRNQQNINALIKSMNDSRNQQVGYKTNEFDSRPIEETQAEFDDSIRLSTFPSYKGYTSNDGPDYITEKIMIKKKNDGTLLAHWLNENKSIVNIDALISDYGIDLKKIEKVHFYIELKNKIEELMSDKQSGLYYLSLYVNNGYESIKKGSYTPIKKFEVNEFYRGQFNKPIEAFKINDIQYQVICDNCEVRFQSKDGFRVEKKSDAKGSWSYLFNDSLDIKKYKLNPKDFDKKNLYGNSGQYVYLYARSLKIGGLISLKIIRDGKIWRNYSNLKGEEFISISGYLP